MIKGVTLTMLPDRYKKSVVLGRGATSLIIDRGDNVEIITCDNIKTEILTDSEYCPKNKYDIIDDIKDHKTNSDFDNLLYYSFLMKKLEKTSSSKEANIESKYIYKEFNKIKDSLEEDSKNMYARFNLDTFNDKLVEKILETEDERLQPLRDVVDSISKYFTGDSYIFDISPRNMLWDKEKNKIFINDAVVPLDVFKCISKDRYINLMRLNQKAINEDIRMKKNGLNFC